MLNLKPGTTKVFPLTLLLLSLAFQPVIAYPGDSLVIRLARTKKPDQQIAILHELYQRTCFENTHEAEKYMMSAIEIGMRTGSTVTLVKSYKLLASLYEQQRNFMQAHLFYQEAQKAAIEADVTEELPLLNYHIGVALCQLDRYPEALTYLQHAALAAPKVRLLLVNVFVLYVPPAVMSPAALPTKFVALIMFVEIVAPVRFIAVPIVPCIYTPLCTVPVAFSRYSMYRVLPEPDRDIATVLV